jgi:hypothetical protein
MAHVRFAALCVLLLVVACAPDLSLGGDDAGSDAGANADAGADAGVQTGNDAGADAGVDAGEDAGWADAGTDAGEDDGGFVDAGVDGGVDAGVDAGMDAGFDAGMHVDAGHTCVGNIFTLGLGGLPESLPATPHLATADFNGDGILDVVGDAVLGVGIYLGLGNGTFAAPGAEYPTAQSLYPPTLLLTADLNHDGKADVIANNDFSPGALSILLGRGDGTLMDQVSYDAGFVSAVAVGDLNRDGNPDLAVAVSAYFRIGVFVGNGDGTFQPVVGYTTPFGYDAIGIAIADFDSDGVPDVATTVKDNGTYRFLVFHGLGDGTLGTSVYKPIPADVRLLTSDFDGDGRPDVASTSGINPIATFFNYSGGGFTVPAPYASQSAIGAGDLDGDGKPDLVFIDSSNVLTALSGLGGGAFGNPHSVALSHGLYGPQLADFDGDGRVDLTSPGGAGIDTLLGNGDGTFLTLETLDAGSFPSGLLAFDQQLLAVNNRSNDVTVRTSNGDGTFGAPTYYPVGSSPSCGVAGDFTGDGVTDVVVLNNGSSDLSVLRGNPGGTFSPLPFTTPLAFAAYGVAASDFNGDGLLDLAVADFGTADGGSSGFGVLMGNGDGTFAAPVNYLARSALGPQALAIGDFNHDGHPDVAIAGHTNDVVEIFRGAANGTFTSLTSASTGDHPVALTAADLDGDQVPELVISVSRSLVIFQGVEVKRMFALGLGTFGDYAFRGDALSTAVGDVDGDGLPDLVAAMYSTNDIVVMLGTAGGGFGAMNRWAVGTNPSSVVLGDWNRDGRLDIAVCDDRVSVLLNRGNVCTR